MNSLAPRAPWRVRLPLLLLRPTLVAELGAAEADAVLAAAAAAIPPLVVALPALPPRRVEAARFLSAVAWLAGVYRALRSHGLPPARAGALVVAASRAALGRVPGPFRRLYRWRFFRPRIFQAFSASIFGDGAPGDFQGLRIEGAYGVDYTGCLIRTWLAGHDLSDFAPWVCILDDVMSDVFGLGLERTGTLAHGASRCDFRFAPGRPGRPLPPPSP